ncbi:MAG: AAA family ATPase [Candidatus Caenarcaniphilales bacterium]|nr:AAA family ATPase [Candidatus Caenarcaniphilales bacterium]
MLTKLTIKNFKKFDDVEIELGNPVVFVGPNNSGKTTALQALALWELGLKRWLEKRGAETKRKQRTGVVINRKDLLTTPIPETNLLWRNLQVRQGKKAGKTGTENIKIQICLEGIFQDSQEWKFGLEFDYHNEETLYCRPEITDHNLDELLKGPFKEFSIAFLPPMSGLSDREHQKTVGEIDFLVGQGRTAEVLRNLCYRLSSNQHSQNSSERWKTIKNKMAKLFGTEIIDPTLVSERGEIEMSYRYNGIVLDISSSGRGFQQILLLLAYLECHPNSILLLDEPDAHLEIIRQKQIYEVLSSTSKELGCNVLIASHSEVLLDEAAGRDTVIAFLGKPHRINNKSQLRKSLVNIGFDQFLQAEQKGWVLYLEGSSDLKILLEFARKLKHKAFKSLEDVFVKYVSNQPSKAQEHFYGLKEAKDNLLGVALFDNLNAILQNNDFYQETQWNKKEIENYLCTKQVLQKWATKKYPHHFQVMTTCIEDLEKSFETLRKPSPWSSEIKVTDDFLNPLFDNFFDKLGLPNSFQKTDYHELIEFLDLKYVDQEVSQKLDLVYTMSQKAKPILI